MPRGKVLTMRRQVVTLPSINRYGSAVVYESDATNLISRDTEALLSVLLRCQGG